MFFKDISTDTQKTYILVENEKCVFFMLNRNGEITFDLAAPGAEAHVFAFSFGGKIEKGTLRILQNHIAPRTTSSVLIKGALSNASEFNYEGTVRIEKDALLSHASQECRMLLLSGEAKASSRPSLEILASDVTCHHAATMSALDREQLFFLQSRGLSPEQAKQVLVEGFFHEALERVKKIDTNFQLPMINFQSIINETMRH